MGRVLKRIALDFSWPLDVVWKGYCNPYRPTDCQACEQTGYNEATKQILDDWYDFEGTGRRWCHNITQHEVDALWERGRLKHDFPEKPTAEQVNEWSRDDGVGHDAINRGICVRARAKREGVFGYCSACEGKGAYWCDDRYEKLWNEWAPIEPPEGEGFQLWENTSEGSPISPVCESLDELCEWLSENGVSPFGLQTATKEQWRGILEGERSWRMPLE